MKLSNEDKQEIRGIFTEMLGIMKSDLMEELRQEFTAQPPQPAEPQQTPAEHFIAQPPQPAEPPPPPPVEYFNAEQVEGLGKVLAQELSGALSQLGQQFNELKTAIENTPNQYAGRPEATGNSMNMGSYI